MTKSFVVVVKSVMNAVCSRTGHETFLQLLMSFSDDHNQRSKTNKWTKSCEVRWVKYRDPALSEALRSKIGTQRRRPLWNQDVICRLLSLLQTDKHIMQSIECIRKHYNFKLFIILLTTKGSTVCVVMSWRVPSHVVMSPGHKQYSALGGQIS